MRIKPEFSLAYDMDLITIVRREADGSERELSPISETAAMAWEGIERGIPFDALVDAIAAEFAGTTKETVAADLRALMTQLVQLGYGEE